MRKIILYSAVTIDGLIARPDGRVDWLDDCGKDPAVGDYGYADFIDGVDATIMGRETYSVTLKLDGMAAMAGFTNYVITRDANYTPAEHITFVSGNVVDHLRDVQKGPGGKIWLLGGGQINSLLLAGGLIDEMILTVIPIVLGEGIPLFAQPVRQSQFSLLSSRSFPDGLVQSHYSVSSSKEIP